MLWRALSIDERDDRAGVVQAWLDRSGCCPLSIELDTSFLYRGEPNECLMVALQHGDRWQHAYLVLAAKEIALIEGPMPLLESVSLFVETLDYTHPATTAGNFPRLRSATLDDAAHGHWLPLSQITTLTLQEVYETNYLAMLQDAVNLVHLHLNHCTALESAHTLTRLETLVVVDRLGRRQTLDMFTLPVLRSLQWSGGRFGRDRVSSVGDLISRSGCQLQQVLFAGTFDASQESLRAALPSVPKITFGSAQ